MTELEELLVRWTIRVAVLIYFLRLYSDLARFHGPTASVVRVLWSLGCLINAIHILMAMIFYHDLSHQHAIEDTAAKTFAVTGIRWGGGVYINYLFSAYWMVDVVLWWCKGLRWPRNNRTYNIVLHLIFGFIVINATAVFGPRFWMVVIPLLYLPVVFQIYRIIWPSNASSGRS